MSRLLWTFLTVVLLWFPVSAGPRVNLDAGLRRSVVRFSAIPADNAPQDYVNVDGRLTCTAFSINGREGYYLTAYHCVEYAVSDLRLAKDDPVGVVKVDKDADLALLTSPIKRLGLKWRPTLAPRGTRVWAAGYAFGQADFYTTSAVVAHTWDSPFLVTPPGYVFYGNFIGGMSGGPIVDEDLKVVSIVQHGGHPASELQDIGGGPGFITLYRFTRGYWK